MATLQHKNLAKSLTLDMSLRPRSIRGGGFLSKMPASYGETMAGLMKRKNMALPTAPMLFWGKRWLTTCMDIQWMEDDEEEKRQKGESLCKENAMRQKDRKRTYSQKTHDLPELNSVFTSTNDLVTNKHWNMFRIGNNEETHS